MCSRSNSFVEDRRRIASNGDIMSSTPQEQRYTTLAEVALRHYALGPPTPTFVQQNAGIVFRVEAPAIGSNYLLKLHKRAGTGANPSAEQLEAGLHWLADLARTTGVTVQVPVATITGQFVCQIAGDDRQPINCTVQHWVAGDPPQGHFTAGQVWRIGALMATLHAYSHHHPAPAGVAAMRHDADALARNVGLLRRALDMTVLPPQAYAVLVAAQEEMTALIQRLGTAPAVWGPVHGDLHHDNLLFVGDEVRPIDFTGLRLAHYAYDQGVTLYHIFYQEPAIRRAFVAGYQHVRPAPAVDPRVVEAFVTYAAIDNIAWNSTIPEQAASPLFQRNLQQLIATFCTNVAEGRPFLFS